MQLNFVPFSTFAPSQEQLNERGAFSGFNDFQASASDIFRCMWRLQNISRWHGAVKSPWSVYAHSELCVFIYREMTRTPMLTRERALMLHDFEEAVLIGDVPTKQKELFIKGNKDYKKANDAVRGMIARRFGTDAITKAFTKPYDLLALAVEYETVYAENAKDDVIRFALELAEQHPSLIEAGKMFVRKYYEAAKLEEDYLLASDMSTCLFERTAGGLYRLSGPTAGSAGYLRSNMDEME